MIKPPELESDAPFGSWSSRACDVWSTLSAAATGDAEGLRLLLGRDPNLCRVEYWYTPPLHFAVREGHQEAVRVLLDAGADPSAVGMSGDSLVTLARDRGHDAVARLLEEEGVRRGLLVADAAEAYPKVHDAAEADPKLHDAAEGDPTVHAAAETDPEMHAAAEADDVETLAHLLDGDPQGVQRRDRKGATPLHRAVAASARRAVELLLDRGADVHALHGSGPGDAAGYAPAGLQPIDLALWTGPFWGVRGDLETARLLLARGASHDLVIASALGDLDRVIALLDEAPRRIGETRPCGKRALSSAAEFGHLRLVELLLSRGALPNWPEGERAPRGAALYAAARKGDRALVELLLDHGADPNGGIDSSGSATYAARTPELRALLLARGGRLDAYDLVWLDEDDKAVRLVAADPRAADRGCGGVLAAACTRGKRDLVVRLLAAGARVPPILTACRSYLLEEPDLLRLLLASGMDPDLPNWLRATPLHDLCGRDGRGRPQLHRLESAVVLLEAGATLSARDEDYRSTPLAWAARNDLPDMAELLLSRGAPTRLPDDEPWATPLAWARRRGHARIAEMLRSAGAIS